MFSFVLLSSNMNPKLGAAHLKVPKGFPDLLENLALEVLRHQPKDIIQFASIHFEKLLEARKSTKANPELAASTIQKHFRGYVARKKLTEQKQAASAIKKGYHEHYLRRSQSAVKIQSYYRGYRSRKSTKDIREIMSTTDRFGLETSATKLQAAFRGYKARKELRSARMSEDLSDEKEAIKRADALGLEASATKIQAAFRGYRTRKNLNQPSISGNHPNEEVVNFLEDVTEKAAVIIQKNYKGYITRKKLQDQV